MSMRFNEDDIHRLITACQCYKENTGSEYMWEQYDDLQQKLKVYLDQYTPSDGR